MALPVLVSLLTFLATFSGGLLGLKYKDKLHLVLGFTAGVLLSVVAFDIFPEIISLVGETGINGRIPMIALVTGFLVFHILEKSLLIHHTHEDNYASHHHPSVGVLSASALIGHSFLDGLGIGLGFQVSLSIGIVVALAVVAHDFTDGLNTVSLMLVNKNTNKRSLMFLFFDSLAPVLGVVASFFMHLSPEFLLVYLGFFAGFLLYIGVSDILPEAHSNKSSFLTIGMTLLGVVFIYVITLVV